MRALEAILTRVTVPQVKMREPGPDDAAIKVLLEAAAAAPDHGRLRPWRFLLVRGEGRARLGELFEQSVLAERPDAREAELEKQRAAPLRAPLLIVPIARLQPQHPKIPLWEQEASAACAVQNILLAAHALGFAGKWSSGAIADSAHVRSGLGLEADERLLGFVYLGTTAEPPPPSPRPTPEDIARPWP